MAERSQSEDSNRPLPLNLTDHIRAHPVIPAATSTRSGPHHRVDIPKLVLTPSYVRPSSCDELGQYLTSVRLDPPEITHNNTALANSFLQKRRFFEGLLSRVADYRKIKARSPAISIQETQEVGSSTNQTNTLSRWWKFRCCKRSSREPTHNDTPSYLDNLISEPPETEPESEQPICLLHYREASNWHDLHNTVRHAMNKRLDKTVDFHISLNDFDGGLSYEEKMKEREDALTFIGSRKALDEARKKQSQDWIEVHRVVKACLKQAGDTSSYDGMSREEARSILYGEDHDGYEIRSVS